MSRPLGPRDVVMRTLGSSIPALAYSSSMWFLAPGCSKGGELTQGESRAAAFVGEGGKMCATQAPSVFLSSNSICVRSCSS